MFKAIVRFTLLALTLPSLLNASHILKDDLLKPEASKLIETMADELFSKTAINGYLIATNEKFPQSFNLVEYSKKYGNKVSKPYLLLIFAPNAIITNRSESTGRVALIPSSLELSQLYDKSDIMDATIDVVASKDKNSIEDKYNIGVVQGFSELADQIANSKNIELTTTIPNDTKNFIFGLKIIVIFGSILLLWMFLLRPIWIRIIDGKK